jgi:hypothetical protein
LATSHANGVTCAMARRWGAGTEDMLLAPALARLCTGGRAG